MDKRKRHWQALEEVYFRAPLPFPGEAKNLLRGDWPQVEKLEYEMDLRIVRVKIRKGNSSSTTIVPFENVLIMKNAVVAAVGA